MRGGCEDVEGVGEGSRNGWVWPLVVLDVVVDEECVESM